MRKGLRRYSGFTAIAILVSIFSIVPASAVVPVDVVLVAGTITAGQNGSQTFEWSTSLTDTGETSPSVEWWSADAPLPSNTPPTGLTIDAFPLFHGVSTVFVNANGSQVAGTYYFKVSLSGVESSLVTLVVAAAVPPVAPVAPVVKTITVGSPSSSLTAGTSGTPTYGVVTSNLLDETPLSIVWVNSDRSAEVSPPIGITGSITKVSSNAATLTLSASNASTAGTYYFLATGDRSFSNLVTLTVAANNSLTDTSPTDTSPIDNSAAIAAAAAQAEIVRKQAIETSKKSLLQKIVEKKTLTLSDLSSSGLQVSSTENAERVNVQIESLRAKNPNQVVTIEVVQLVVKKERLVERLLDSVSKQNVMSADLIEVGLITQESKIKSSVTVALKKLPASSLDSFEKIQAAIASLEKIAADRKARLAAILDKLKR